MTNQAAAQKHAGTNDAHAAEINELQAKHAAELKERAQFISELEKRLIDAHQHMVAQKEAYDKWFAASREAQKAADERIQTLEKFERRTWDQGDQRDQGTRRPGCSSLQKRSISSTDHLEHKMLAAAQEAAKEPLPAKESTTG